MLLLHLVLVLHVHLLLMVLRRSHSLRELTVGRRRVGHPVLRHVHSSWRVEARVTSLLLHLHRRVSHILELRRRLVVRVEGRVRLLLLLLLLMMDGKRSNGHGEEGEKLGVRSVGGGRTVGGRVERIGS